MSSFLTVHVLLTATLQTQAIDDLYRSVTQTKDAEKEAEGKKIIEEIAKIKYEVQHDRALTYGSLSKVSASLLLTILYQTDRG